ncbi:MAG: DUF308 domain-containing protein [Caulobacteraceae bacterium]|nr:DUF308 domain-containing protein [Caulobacter sp.]
MATFGTASAAQAPGRPSTWFTIEGAVLIVLGVLAFIAPFAAGAAATSLLGVVIFLAGVFGLVSTFAGGRHTHRAWSVISAVIAIVAGLLIAIFPVAGASALALIVAAYLLFDGISMIMISLDQRKRHTGRWGWLLAAGIADILLAILVMLLSPMGATILVGIIVAVDLILAGIALIGVGRGKPVTVPSPI